MKRLILYCRDEGVDIGSDSSVKGQQRSFSVDSLFDTSSIMSTEDAAGCFQSQCNQIFIGMVTMQYQARQVSQPFSLVARKPRHKGFKM